MALIDKLPTAFPKTVQHLASRWIGGVSATAGPLAKGTAAAVLARVGALRTRRTTAPEVSPEVFTPTPPSAPVPTPATVARNVSGPRPAAKRPASRKPASSPGAKLPVRRAATES